MASKQTSKFSDSQLSFHRPVDGTDPGFMIKGYKLRWLSGGVEVRRAGRIWVPLKLSDLPAKALEKLKDYQGSWFSGGDTVRRKDLTLAYAPLEQVEQRRRELREGQNLNEGVFRGKVSHGSEVTSKGSIGSASMTDADNYK